MQVPQLPYTGQAVMEKLTISAKCLYTLWKDDYKKSMDKQIKQKLMKYILNKIIEWREYMLLIHENNNSIKIIHVLLLAFKKVCGIIWNNKITPLKSLQNKIYIHRLKLKYLLTH